MAGAVGGYDLCGLYLCIQVLSFFCFQIPCVHYCENIFTGVSSGPSRLVCALYSSFLFIRRNSLAQLGCAINLYFLFFFACKYPFVCVNEDKAEAVFHLEWKVQALRWYLHLLIQAHLLAYDGV